MLFGKVLKLLILVVVVFGALYLVGGIFLGPGIGDYSEPLVNGYEYEDAGHFEKHIIYVGADGQRHIVVDSRVDKYQIDGSSIYVARKPREIYSDGGVTKTRLSTECEYWLVDTVTHEAKLSENNRNLRCE